VINLVYDDSELTISPQTIVFSATTWNLPHFVEVNALDDREDKQSIEWTSIHHVVASEDLHYGAADSSVVPEFVVQIVDNNEWDGSISVDWDGILATYHLDTGAVQASDIAALTSSSHGIDFQVEVLRRVVEASPESALVIAETLALEKPALLVRAGGAIVRAAPKTLFVVADKIMHGLLGDDSGGSTMSDETVTLVTGVIGGLLDAAMETMEEETFPGQTPASVLHTLVQQRPQLKEAAVKAVQSRALAHLEAVLSDGEDAVFSIERVTLRVPSGAVASGRKLKEGSDHKQLHVRVYDCGLVSIIQLKGECIGIEPSWDTDVEPLLASITLEFPAGEDTNICIQSADELSHNWHKVHCTLVNGIAVYTTTSPSAILSTGIESVADNKPTIMLYRDITNGGLFSRNEGGITTEVSQSRTARFLGITVDTENSDVYYSDGLSIQVFSISTPGTRKVALTLTPKPNPPKKPTLKPNSNPNPNFKRCLHPPL
jgi:hypothetical protein